MEPVTSGNHLLELKDDALATLATALALAGLNHLRVEVGGGRRTLSERLDEAVLAVDLPSSK